MLATRHSDWPAILTRVVGIAPEIPDEGMSVAAFERLALADVDPVRVPSLLDALGRKKAIWTRRQRGSIRVYAKRPRTIVGIFEGAKPIDRLLAIVAPLMAQIAIAVTARDAAKACGDGLAAQEARDELDSLAGRLVAVVLRARDDVHIEDCRRTFWRTFHPDAMSFVEDYEPALGLTSTQDTLSLQTSPSRRIAANLRTGERVAALIDKAGESGITKSDLTRGVRPRVPADDIATALNSLMAEGKVIERSVRVDGSGRKGVRYRAATT